MVNVGGVRELRLALQPGVNELRGRNGAGKSSAIRAIARAAGGDEPLEVRDGAAHGTVEGPGVSLRVGRVVRATGVAEVSLADVGALADLIDPGIADSDAANRARIRALLRMVALPVTEEAVLTLAGGDGELAAAAMSRIRQQRIDDLLGAAEAVRLAGHELARGAGRAADLAELARRTAEERAAGLDRELGGQRATVTAREAEAAAREAALELVRAEEAARRRADLEAQQAEIRATLGERPDVGEAAEVWHASVRAVDEQLGRLAELRQQLAREEGRLETLRAGLAQAKRDLDAARLAADQHDRRAELLARPVEGPTAAEVEAARLILEARNHAVTRARATEELATREAEAAAATLDGERHRGRAEELRTAAVTVGDRLGELLAGSPADGLSVEDGRLCAVVGGQSRDFATRLSDGERVAAALRVAARCYRGGIVPLSGDWWLRLDPQAQQEFARAAAELGLYVITERPVEAAGIEVAHLPEAGAA